MIEKIDDLFVLNTENTTYSFKLLETGHLEHLYYGRKIKIANSESLCEKVEFNQGNLISYDRDHVSLGLENRNLEMSSIGKGDIREPFVDVIYADGNRSCDFVYKGYEITDNKIMLNNLPSSYCDEEEGAKSLIVELKDRNYDVSLYITYSVFYKTNVITRSARIVNREQGSLTIKRLMSTQIDFEESDMVFSTFHGAWAREMNRQEVPCKRGIIVNDSKTGFTSNRSNPFVMLSDKNTTDEYGNCYGFNLVYSGNHYEAVEVNSFGKLRFISGISPYAFSYVLEKDETFEAPEAVMSYSRDGYMGLSRNMHEFVREHIVRGTYKKKERPVLINSWESFYFKFNEGKLLKLARKAKSLGVELFVLDDGWFGKRNDDTTSLGDWTVNRDKLPNGLEGLAKKINDIGLDFGIWVEPEMVNEESECYKNHPDYVIKSPTGNHSEGRNQMILDLTRREVREYVIDSMRNVLSSANIKYVKWDMNRIFSDIYSSALPRDRQEELSYRYIVGLYEVMKTLTEEFTEVLFEGCAAGGNRFDLAILSYMPQIWASDNTDAICRAQIQTGYSYGYPMSVISAHVSGTPNHQTLRVTSLDTRFNIAAFGLLGYETNLCELSSSEAVMVREQIEFYKKYREVLQYGDYYRVKNGEDDIYQWNVVSKDKKTAIAVFLTKCILPNVTKGNLYVKGLDDDTLYDVTARIQPLNVKDFGDLINTIAPIHIKKDSLVHNAVAKIVKLTTEKHEFSAYGDALNYGGIKLKQGFAATGYNENVRMFKDFDSRLYVFRAK